MTQKMRTLLIVWMWIAGTGYAQSPFALRIDQTAGLPSNEIYDLIQDRNGFVWLCTDKGLTRFDGIHYQRFGRAASKPGAYLQEDADGNIWYCTFDGTLIHTLGDSVVRLEGIPPIVFHAFVVKGDRVYGIATNAYLTIDRKTGKLVESQPSNSALLAGTGMGEETLYALSPVLSGAYPGGRVLPLASVRTGDVIQMAITGGKVWISHYRETEKTAIFLWEGANQPIRKVITMQESVQPLQLSITDSTLWVCTRTGVYGYATAHPEAEPIHYFETEKIAKVYKDQQGNHWFTTTDAGLLLVPDLDNRVIATGKYTSRSLFSLPQGLFAINAGVDLAQVEGTRCKTIYTLEQETAVFDLEQAAACPNMSGLLRTVPVQGGSLLMAYSGGKDIQPLDATCVALAETHGVSLIAPAGAGPGIWTASMARMARDGYGQASVFNEATRTKSLAWDSAGQRLFIATNRGLFRLTPQALTEVQPQGKPFAAVRLAESHGHVWALSDEGALWVCAAGSEDFRPLASLNQRGPIKTIRLSGGYLFVLHAWNVEYARLPAGAFAPESLDFQPLRILFNADHILDLHAYRDQLYVALENRLVNIGMATVTGRQAAYPFRINGVRLGGVARDWLQPISVSARDNDLEVAFSLFDFLAPQSHRLEYQINGGRWKQLSPDSRQLRLDALTPMAYALRFRVDGQPAGEVIRFGIVPPVYQRGWFVALMVLLVGGGGWVYFRWRLRVQARTNQLLVDKIQLESNLRQSRLAAIKSQMNPHFLFNSLNTIQSFIITEDTARASGYLSKFSKLTRKVLEMSEQEYISLAEEVEMQQVYLSLEKMRFDNLDYQIEISPDLQPQTILIPSMILQPYVENAIRHGLLHKRGERLLRISIQPSGPETLLMEVDDNGVGRKLSAELNQIKHKDHVSFATGANQQRLDLLNEGRTEKTVVFIDKTDAQGQPCGTTVRITLPIGRKPA